jgi:glycosyltransferase involved in cell wall biosynthesis
MTKHILVTNDDGVMAPGLLALVSEMRKLGKVSVLAPDRNFEDVFRAHPIGGGVDTLDARGAELIEARPEANGAAPDGTTLRLLRVAHGGKGAAVRAGMLDATADLIVFADADMATPPDQLPLLVAALTGHDVSLGSRIQADGSDMRASQPGYRRFLGKAFHLLASIWVVGPVKDTQCGFKGFTRAAAHDLFARQRITSIVFDVELIYLARRRGYRLAIVPIRWYDRRGSRMRASPGLALRVAWDLFRIPLIHRRSGRGATSAS